jgi:hypothetical protein
MRVLWVLPAVAVLALGAGFARADDDDDGGAGPCVAKKFETKLTEEACKKGGQKEAKKAWKEWQKATNKANADAELGCKSCHSKLAPEFPLKPDAMATYKKYGGT